LPRRRGVVAADLVAHRLAQLVERFKAERLGEVVVDGDGAGGLDRLRRDRELGVLSGERLDLIVRREGHLEGAVLAGGDADELILEAGDESVRADQHRGVVAGAALEGLAVDGAGIGDDDTVALLRLAAFGTRRERLVLFGDAVQALVDLGVGDVGDRLLDLDVLEVAERDRRHDLDRDRVGEIALALDQVLDLVLRLRQRHLRVGGELEAALGDDLAVGVADRALDDLGHGGAAVHALEMLDRHRARTEAVDAHLRLDLVEAGIDLGVEFGGRDDHLVFALQAFGERFGHLPWVTLFSACTRVAKGTWPPAPPVSGMRARRPARIHKPLRWCGRRDSNPHDFRHWNLNPARLPVPPRPQRATTGASCAVARSREIAPFCRRRAYITRVRGRSKKMGRGGAALKGARARLEGMN